MPGSVTHLKYKRFSQFVLLLALACPLLAFQNCGHFETEPAELSDDASFPRDEYGNLVTISKVDARAPLTGSSPKLEFIPAVSSVAVNNPPTVNWSAGSGVAATQVHGEIKIVSGTCQASSTLTWTQVEQKTLGAGMLSVPSTLAGCRVQYCLVLNSQTRVCQPLEVTSAAGWVSLSSSHTQVAVGQEIAYQWESSQTGSLTGNVQFSGASCSLGGQTKTWNDILGVSATASGVVVKEALASFANCTARFCLSATSSTNGQSVQSCQEIAFQPSTARPPRWVRDGRYLYDPNFSRAPHITWSLANNPASVEVGVGTSPGRADVIPWTRMQNVSGAKFQTANNFFAYGQTYFASVRALNSSGAWSVTSGNGWRFINDQDAPRTSPYSVSTPTWTNPSMREVADDDFVGLRTSADLDATRARLIRQLWPKQGRLPTNLPSNIVSETNIAATLQTVIGNTTRSGINDSDVVAQFATDIAAETDRLTRLVVTLPSGLQSHVFYFTPKRTPANRLAIVHQGHDDVLGTYGGGRSILFFLRNGFEVAALFMPASGENQASFETFMNQQTVYQVPANTRPYHNDLFEVARLLPTAGLGEHPIATYLTPVRVTLNYLNQFKSYRDITMIGCSGGGWTTTLYAAIDPQIRYSFPVAGSVPLSLRRYRPVDYSDGEQHSPDVYSLAGYRDLYVLGAAGSGRKQIQILNGQDDCCFRPTSPNGDLTYITAYSDIYENYLPQVKQAALEFGGTFNTVVDSPAPHTISQWTLWTVVAPELGLKPQPTLKMNGLLGGTSTLNRTSVQGDLDLHYEWNCPNCTGALTTTYDTGGSCGSSTDQPANWLQTLSGTYVAGANASRIGCWITFKLQLQGSPDISRSYFNWAAP